MELWNHLLEGLKTLEENTDYGYYSQTVKSKSPSMGTDR